ncbi:MAG TPA: hypothetical protein DD379_09275, partial [Cyanobacteria bacterium UBA11162]|nr:hypothetical protein [Cyanobacteria bacterium UBA11162]
MEQTNYGDKNYQIKAEKIERVGDNIYPPLSPSAEEMLSKGVQLLNQRVYSEAESVLKDAIKTDPSLSDAYYYLAIALLRGRKPRKIDGWTIQDIEEKLNAAIDGNAKSSKYYVLLAIVKHGHYAMNSFIESSPTSAQLFSLGESIQAE